jgi:hypothetical protein
MKRNTQLTIDFDEVLLWTNWIDCASRRLSFPRPPAELLVLFVVQSLELAHSLDSIVDERLPAEILNGHVRGYLLDRIWSYQLMAATVRDDVKASRSRPAHSDSEKLLRKCRSIVARMMLRKRAAVEDISIRSSAHRSILRSLRISAS